MHTTNSSNSPRPTLDAETHALVEELFKRVRAGDTAQLARLLEMGLVANLRDSKGDSLLMLACYHGHAAMAELLLRHGADTELTNDRGQTPLGAAAYKGDLVVAGMLVRHGALVDGASPGGKTPLMLAAMFNRTQMVELLLEHGADPELQAGEGLSARDLARAMGADETARQLSESHPG